MAPMKTGLVLGKFMPLHKGHELLLYFAAHFVETLYVVVDNINNAPIPGELRCQWIKQLLPNATVLYLPSPNPQEPSLHKEFWSIWKNSLLKLLPQKPDYVFASEPYGYQLAHVLGATFIPFDMERSLCPVSGTEIRQAPFKYWEYLSVYTKEFYLKRFCIFGPESSGKSTLARQLAAHYQTVFVPEYARLFLEAKNEDGVREVPKEVKEDDLWIIANGQLALEKALAPVANKMLFCDTDALTTTFWSQWLYGKCQEPLSALADRCDYALYLVMKPDIEWKQDSVRYFPEQSDAFFAASIELLRKREKKFVVVSGQGEDRLRCAINHIDEFLSCLA